MNRVTWFGLLGIILSTLGLARADQTGTGQFEEKESERLFRAVMFSHLSGLKDDSLLRPILNGTRDLNSMTSVELEALRGEIQELSEVVEAGSEGHVI